MGTILFITALAASAPAQPPGDASESLGFGVLVTDAGKVYEGQIDRSGKLFRVLSAGKSELIRDVNVAFQGSSRTEAYEHFRAKKKAGIAEDAAKLADWCRMNGLGRQAVNEARIAVQLAPDNRAMAKLLKDCEEEAKKDKPTVRVVGNPPPPATTPMATMPPAVIPTLASGESRLPADLETQFAKTVQPVFMNVCANCHADVAKPVSFRLSRVPEGVTVSMKTNGNALASLAWIVKDSPQNSPLIQKAMTAHGGKSSAPLTPASAASKNLVAWVTAVAAALPASTPQKTSAAVPVAAVLPTPVSPPSPVPAAKPKAADPFDPAEFNGTNRKP